MQGNTKLLSMSRYYRYSILLLFTFLWSGLLYVWWIKPYKTYYMRLLAEEQGLRQTLLRYLEESSLLPDYQKYNLQLERQFMLEKKFWSYPHEKLKLLEEISQFIQKSGLKLEAFMAQAEIPNQQYTILPVQIKIRGNYRNILSFLFQIMQLKRIISIKDFKIERHFNKELHKTDLVMELISHAYWIQDHD